MAQDCYCTQNDCYRAGAKLASVSWLIVHSPAVYPTIIRALSGAGGGWKKRWDKPGVEKLVHGFIDDTGVYNFAPLDMACWQIGDAWGNKNCIGYELCELETAEEFDKMWENAVEHYAWLCKKFGLGADRVIGHYEAHAKGFASNHSDPEPYFARIGRSMEDFRADVKKRLNGANTGPQGQTSKVTKTYDPWGYAKVTNLTAEDPLLNVRSGPGVENRVIRQLAQGNEVDVLALYDNGWAKINIVGQQGYVNAHYLDITNRKEEDTQPAGYAEWVGKACNLGGSRLNVRTGPGTSYGLLAGWPKLAEGNLVSVIGESDGWYQVRIAGKYVGWVSKEYLCRA